VNSEIPEELQQFERSYCDCGKCKAACKSMPGMLAPGDIKAIANLLDTEPDENFVAGFFAASEGALVLTKDGPQRIRTITPRQKPDGSCVFLTSEEKCSIHKVSPFGCRAFSVCAADDINDDLSKLAAALMLCHVDSEYKSHWDDCDRNNSRTPPLMERRANLHRLLAAEDDTL